MSSIIIADFGMATYLDKENMMLKYCGTPGYLDPEILEKVKKNN